MSLRIIHRLAILVSLVLANLFLATKAQGQDFVIDYPLIVSSGVSRPSSLAFIGPNDFLVLEKLSGDVKRVQLPGPVITTVLHLSVVGAFDSGLLSIALHPDFDSVGFVYLLYSPAFESGNRIERYYWDGSQLSNPTLIWTYSTPSFSNRTGAIVFGHDRKLYLTINDPYSQSPTMNNSSAPLRELGCMLRLNDDGTIPMDNPFIGNAGWERIFAYGISISLGMTIDPMTGFLWETEITSSEYAEVNRIMPGFNGGWKQISGPDYRVPLDPNSLVIVPGASYRNPEFSWRGNTTVLTSIQFLDSPRWPAAVRDDCLVGNSEGNIIRLELSEDRTEFQLSGAFADKVADLSDNVNLHLFFGYVPGLTDLKLGPDGFLYGTSNNLSRIYKVRPRFPMGDINLDQSVTDDDLPLFLDLILGNSADPQQITQADFDGDSSITGLDIQGFVDSLRLPN